MAKSETGKSQINQLGSPYVPATWAEGYCYPNGKKIETIERQAGNLRANTIQPASRPTRPAIKTN